MIFEPLDQPVRGGSREPRSLHDVGERSSAPFDGAQHGHAAVEDADGGPGRIPSKLLGGAGPPCPDAGVVSEAKLPERALAIGVHFGSCYHKGPVYGTLFHYMEHS